MQAYVARQPIFDKQLHIYAYELLFRSGSVNAFSQLDPDKATSGVLADSMFLIGMDKLTNGKLALVNFSDKFFKSDIMKFLPKREIGIEILETVDPTEEIIEACRQLKKEKYKIVLDDFVYDPKFDVLIDMADIIKIDFLNTSAEYCEAMPKRFKRKQILFLAEKIETYDQFKQAVKWGYSLFQGYFFCKPDILTTKDIEGNQIIYFQLLKELNNPLNDVLKIEHLVHKDVALSYKILKYINSSAFGFRTKINSIRQAVTLLGNKKLVNFISLVLMKGMANKKPSELIVNALIRARFSELMAMQLGLKNQSADAFLIGMLSLLEALLDRPLQSILAELPLRDNVSAALEGKPSIFTSILKAVTYYEQDWEQYDVYRQKMGLDEALVNSLYFEAVAWSSEIEK